MIKWYDEYCSLGARSLIQNFNDIRKTIIEFETRKGEKGKIKISLMSSYTRDSYLIYVKTINPRKKNKKSKGWK